MSWTVACFCGHLFDGPASRCPRCGTPVPVENVRPHPHRGHLDALIASVRDLEPRSASPLPLGAGRVLDHVLTVRPAAPHDTDAVRRLACLAGRPRPLGHALLAEEDGIPVAAVGLTSGAVFADALLPPTVAVRALRLRRYQLLRQGGDTAPLWARCRGH